MSSAEVLNGRSMRTPRRESAQRSHSTRQNIVRKRNGSRQGSRDCETNLRNSFNVVPVRHVLPLALSLRPRAPCTRQRCGRRQVIAHRHRTCRASTISQGQSSRSDHRPARGREGSGRGLTVWTFTLQPVNDRLPLLGRDEGYSIRSCFSQVVGYGLVVRGPNDVEDGEVDGRWMGVERHAER